MIGGKLGGHWPARDTGIGGVRAGSYRGCSPLIGCCPIVTKLGVVTDIGRDPEKSGFALADGIPSCRVELEVAGTGFEIDKRDRRCRWPAKGAPRAELAEHVLGQYDIAPQVWVLRIVEKKVINDPMRALGFEQLRPIDQ